MMIYAIAVCFTGAFVAPLIYKIFQNKTHWFLSLVPSYVFIQTVMLYRKGEVQENYSWVPSMGIEVSLLGDGLSFLFVALISGIGFFIILYSGEYMKGNPFLHQFYVFLLAFMGAMVGLAFSNNIFLLFVFWELTSISSFFLIGFQNDKKESRQSAWKALLVTSLGGLALLVGLIFLSLATGTFEISEMNVLSEKHSFYFVIVICIFLGAATKSAQFPFHFWLPGAMAAPTPVSAYLHSSTMVKAGIYLLARLNPVLGDTSLWQNLLVSVGLTTALIGAFVALHQTIFKRMLAFSTVSALGIMTMLIGLGGKYALQAFVIFLVAHALYKACLFLVAGIIDYSAQEKDTEKISGLRSDLPLVAVASMIAALSFAGIPPLFGFLAKEILYDTVLYNHSLLIPLVFTANVFLVAVAICVGIKPFLGNAISDNRIRKPSFLMVVGPLVLSSLTLTLFTLPFAPDLVISAASASTEISKVWELKLWHGWKMPLVLGIATLLCGMLLYRIRMFYRRIPIPQNWSEKLAIELWKSHEKLAVYTTRTLQNGYLTRYIFVTLTAAFSLIGMTMLLKTQWAEISFGDSWFWVDTVIAVITMFAIVATVTFTNRLAAICALGVVGTNISLIFVFYGAPDLAMTQFTIEILTLILFILVFRYLPEVKNSLSTAIKVRNAVIAIFAGTIFGTMAYLSSQVQYFQSISTYFVQNSVPEGKGNNIVNVILVDFRSLDTFGEIIVLAIAGIGAYALLRLKTGREADD